MELIKERNPQKLLKKHRNAMVISIPQMIMRELNYDVMPYLDDVFWLLWKDNYLLIELPRGHGKSIAMACYCIQNILKNPNIRIMIVSDTSTQSTEFMRIVMGWFERPDFKEMFGDFTNKNVKWTNSEMIVAKRTRVARESTISATSFGGSVVSRHVDIIIVDDIVDRENSRTQGRRDAVKAFFFETLIPVLEPKGKLIVTGTPWHYDDLYAEIKAVDEQGERLHPEFSIYRRPTPENPEYDNRGHLTGGDPIWKKHYPMEELIKRYRNMGSIFYNTQYFLDPSGQKGRVFQADWFKPWVDLPAGLRYYIGVDPAVRMGEQHDYTAIVTIGVDRSGNIFVMDVFKDRIPVTDQITEIEQRFLNWRPITIGIETVAYQATLMQHLESKGFPIQEFKSPPDKMTKALRLQPYFQNGKVFVKKGLEEVFIKEFVRFPDAEHDDVFDAFDYALESSLGGTMIIKNYDSGKRRETFSDIEGFSSDTKVTFTENLSEGR